MEINSKNCETIWHMPDNPSLTKYIFGICGSDISDQLYTVRETDSCLFEIRPSAQLMPDQWGQLIPAYLLWEDLVAVCFLKWRPSK